jgi:phospholipid/cholesterol/gamma-HCH transport system permease protein
MFAASARLTLGYGSMLVHAFTERRLLRQPEVQAACLRQIHFTGVQGLPYVAVVALLFGTVVVTQALDLLGADNEVALKAVVWGGIRELGPLVTALLIVVRSSVAIAAEVALMRLRGGISDTLWKDAVHEQEVVLPRVLGVAVSALLLVAYFQCIAITAALVATAFTLGTTVQAELEQFLGAASWWQVPFSLGKSALMGAGIAAIACHHGLEAEHDVGDIRKAVVATGIGSLSFVIAVDLLALLFLLA